MNDKALLNTIYDIIAQNDVEQSEHDHITYLIDHVDSERKAIIFRLDNGREFELQLVDTYAPAPEVKR